MKLLVFTLDFCLERLRGINNAKSDNKYKNTNTQPILARKFYDICKFQLFEKMTISRKVLNTGWLYLDCICHFQARPHKAKSFTLLSAWLNTGKYQYLIIFKLV